MRNRPKKSNTWNISWWILKINASIYIHCNSAKKQTNKPKWPTNRQIMFLWTPTMMLLLCPNGKYILIHMICDVTPMRVFSNTAHLYTNRDILLEEKPRVRRSDPDRWRSSPVREEIKGSGWTDSRSVGRAVVNLCKYCHPLCIRSTDSTGSGFMTCEETMALYVHSALLDHISLNYNS